MEKNNRYSYKPKLCKRITFYGRSCMDENGVDKYLERQAAARAVSKSPEPNYSRRKAVETTYDLSDNEFDAHRQKLHALLHQDI